MWAALGARLVAASSTSWRKDQTMTTITGETIAKIAVMLQEAKCPVCGAGVEEKCSKSANALCYREHVTGTREPTSYQTIADTITGEI